MVELVIFAAAGVFAGLAVVKIYERRQDVLYGPYIHKTSIHKTSRHRSNRAP